jgi:hypothetical protein
MLSKWDSVEVVVTYGSNMRFLADLALLVENNRRAVVDRGFDRIKMEKRREVMRYRGELIFVPEMGV